PRRAVRSLRGPGTALLALDLAFTGGPALRFFHLQPNLAKRLAPGHFLSPISPHSSAPSACCFCFNKFQRRYGAGADGTSAAAVWRDGTSRQRRSNATTSPDR